MIVRDPWKVALALLLAGPFLLSVAPALAVPLIFYALYNAPRAVKAMRGISRPKLWVLALTGCGILALAVVLVVLWMEKAWMVQSKGLHFWVQVFSGNWSPGSADDAGGDYAFSISIALALILNYSPYGAVAIAVVAIFKRIKHLEEKHMSLTGRHLMRLRDFTIKTEFLSLFTPEERAKLGLAEKLNVAFERGDKEWSQDALAVPLRPEEREQYLKDLGREVAPH